MDQAAALLDQLDRDIDAVAAELTPLLDGTLAARAGSRAAAPPALSAYAFGSLLFAYLRSEGDDGVRVLPELEKVKAALAKIDAAEAAAGDAGAAASAGAGAGAAEPARAEPAPKPRAKGKKTVFRD